MACAAWTGLQLVVDILVRRFDLSAADDDVVDVRDPLLDLTTCPHCGTDLSMEASA